MVFDFLPLIVFLFGTLFGSFLNVVILRFKKRSVVSDRSRCPHCQRVLSPIDLVPVLSYVFLRGSCRTCKHPLSIQYPLVELATGLLFFFIFLTMSPISTVWGGLIFVLTCAIAALLIVIVVYDMRHMLVPNVFVYPFASLAFMLLFIDPTGFHDPLVFDLLAGPLLFLPFFLLWLLSLGQWIGLGDGKLALGIGWFLGLPGGFSAILLAFWIGAVVSLFLLFFQKIHTRISNDRTLSMKSEVPFAPFLIIGVALVYFYSIDVMQLVSTAL